MFELLMLALGFLILCLSILHSEKIFNSCGDSFDIVVFAALVVFGIIITAVSAIVLIA
jgi:hypothetical protein